MSLPPPHVLGFGYALERRCAAAHGNGCPASGMPPRTAWMDGWSEWMDGWMDGWIDG
ncbi:unnamed protein product [Diplocarpon coronariae]